jgi:hypothetical protein
MDVISFGPGLIVNLQFFHVHLNNVAWSASHR